MSTDNKTSLLRAATLRSDEEEARRLLADGADPNAMDPGCMAPLHYAVWRNDLDVAEILLKAGADPNLKTHDQATPLWYAEDDFGLHEMATLLRRYGAVEK